MSNPEQLTLRRARLLPTKLAAAILAVLFLAGCASTAGPGQVPDLEYQPPIVDPVFDVGAGPLVLIDEAHFNFHTAGGRYRTFAELLRRDGYVVRPHTGPFTEASLATARILVISNALSEDDSEEWVLPSPSAFTAAEIDAVEAWVQRGGSLRAHPITDGRSAAFGEAAMFSALVFGEQRTPMGMNNPAADENYQFLLNVVRWLSGQLD